MCDLSTGTLSFLTGFNTKVLELVGGTLQSNFFGGLSIAANQTLTMNANTVLDTVGQIKMNNGSSLVLNNGSSTTINFGSTFTFTNGTFLTLASGAGLNTQLPSINLTGNWVSGVFASNTSAAVILPLSSKDNNRSRGTFNYDENTGVFTIPMTGIYSLIMTCDQNFGSLQVRFEIIRNSNIIYLLNRTVEQWEIHYKFNSGDAVFFRYWNYSASSVNLTRSLDLQLTFIN